MVGHDHGMTNKKSIDRGHGGRGVSGGLVVGVGGWSGGWVSRVGQGGQFWKRPLCTIYYIASVLLFLPKVSKYRAARAAENHGLHKYTNKVYETPNIIIDAVGRRDWLVSSS